MVLADRVEEDELPPPRPEPEMDDEDDEPVMAAVAPRLDTAEAAVALMHASLVPG